MLIKTGIKISWHHLCEGLGLIKGLKRFYITLTHLTFAKCVILVNSNYELLLSFITGININTKIFDFYDNNKK